MTRKPSRGPGARIPENPLAALDYELAQEQASALGRQGRQLEAALAALAAFDAEHDSMDSEGRCNARRAMVAEAGAALWQFIVQREALGLRDSTRVMRDYNVPNEVRDCMGVFPQRKLTS